MDKEMTIEKYGDDIRCNLRYGMLSFSRPKKMFDLCWERAPLKHFTFTKYTSYFIEPTWHCHPTN